MSYRDGMETLAGADETRILRPTVSDDRNRALHGIGSLGGGLLLARAWPKHWFWAFVLGSSLGWKGATLVTGREPRWFERGPS